MRLSDLNYRLYRATDGETCFWRWEVLPKGKGRGNSSTPLKSGFLYGTMADAKQRASAAMSELARIKERPIEVTHQFCAESLGSASVSKDGMEILLEFESEGERLWVTFPSSAIERLKTLVQDAHTIAVDASNGIAQRWHTNQK